MSSVNRRAFIRGAGALFMSPAIVRVSSLMPVRAFSGGMWAMKTADEILDDLRTGFWASWGFYPETIVLDPMLRDQIVKDLLRA